MSNPVIAAMQEPIKSSPVFMPGQTVRVLKHIDVNMPESLNYWLDTKCEVVSCRSAGLLSKVWVYELKHPDGNICEFRDYELDGRYRRKFKQ